MKKYLLSDRVFLGKVITGVKTLTRETDAHLAEILEVHRANVTSFNGQKRPHALSAVSVDTMLRHYGFQFDAELGLSAAKGNFCPVISFRGEHDLADSRIEDLVKCLQRNDSQHLQLLKIQNEAGAFILLWDLNETTAEGWCAVALGLGANNAVLEQLSNLTNPAAPTVMIDPETYLNWCETNPRKSEVLSACIKALRNKRSEDTKQLLDSAMSQNEPKNDTKQASSTTNTSL